MGKINQCLELLAKYMAASGFIIVFALTLTQIIYRNFFGSGFAWIEEASTLLLSSFAFFAISYSVRLHNYTFLDFFYNKFGSNVQRMLNIITYFLIIFFLGYVFYISIGFSQRQWRALSSILSWPRTFWYLSFPINCLVMISFLLEELGKTLGFIAAPAKKAGEA